MMLLQRQVPVSKPRRRPRTGLHDLVTGYAPARWLAPRWPVSRWLVSRQLPSRSLPDGLAGAEPGYADSFFADPVAVEDDYRRMRRG